MLVGREGGREGGAFGIVYCQVDRLSEDNTHDPLNSPSFPPSLPPSLPAQDNPSCSGRSLDHHLLVVGFDDEAWICKGSWGEGWGEEGGYVRLVRGKNMCGLAEWAVVPVVGGREGGRKG